MHETVINLDHLTKYYGKSRGVRDLNLTVRRGEIFGYLGPNGAGKTTTIRVLLDAIRPTEGAAQVMGMDSRGQSEEIKRRLGYLPGELALYDNLSGSEYLRYFAHLRGGVDWSFARGLAARLDVRLSQRIGSLSQGNKRKIGLVQAIMHRPELLILDEPSNGLDPLVQQELYRMLLEFRADGGTVFLSSHNLPEVERICDRVAVIREGNLVAVEEIEVLKRRAYREIEIHFAQRVPAQAFAGVEGIRRVRVDEAVLHCAVVGSLDALVKAAAQFEVINIVSHEPSLERIFLAYYGGGRDDAA